MTTFIYEPCICHKCNTKQFYKILMTTNSFDPFVDMTKLNSCYNCLADLSEDDIDTSSCSPVYKAIKEN